MRLILLGCPGAGKGTQAKLIIEKLHIPQISTGEILRSAIANGSELGKKVKQILDQGNLVPDDVVIALVDERIKQADCEQGFLLDGFPRTIAQAEALKKLTPIDYVIDIDVPEEEIIKRLTGRRIHPGSGRIYHLLYQPPKEPNKDDLTGEPLIQRPDDTEETVTKRMSVYHEQTSPLREFYQSQDYLGAPQYIKIDGTGSVDDIKEHIFSIIRKRISV